MQALRPGKLEEMVRLSSTKSCESHNEMPQVSGRAQQSLQRPAKPWVLGKSQPIATSSRPTALHCSCLGADVARQRGNRAPETAEN